MWSIETIDGGYFEGEKLDELVDNVAEFYSEYPDGRIPGFEAVKQTHSHGEESFSSQSVVESLQFIAEEELDRIREENCEEAEHHRQIHSDYYASRI